MKMLYGMAVVVLVLLVTAAAFAVAAEAPSAKDGNALLRQCTDALRVEEQPNPNIELVNAMNAGLCIGLVWGMLDLNRAYTVYQATNPNNRLLFCLPVNDGITPSQGMRIILRYLQTHPERLHQNGSVLAVQALREAFPCPTAPT